MTEKERRELLELYGLKKEEIQNQLLEFRQAFQEADDLQIFRELSFCILSSGVGPKIAGQCMSAIGEKLVDGEEDELLERTGAIHKYAENTSHYIVFTREYLREEHGFLLKSLVSSFEDRVERRDFFAKNPGIKGLGSYFPRKKIPCFSEFPHSGIIIPTAEEQDCPSSPVPSSPAAQALPSEQLRDRRGTPSQPHPLA